ncbi:MAG: glutamine-hydrolyzing carbamoyl-phosphate synthase small subunit [Desulfovibrio sp.]|nr:glutamine-hydrolyzing carbamoyl-phosphate synthase small subunit [Desulfovibrio sp.]MCA1985984.1 glutamine-hydrolyzing carbamoyl-phosphate synthase small subunit [Desulfovibrio sp.]
MRAILALEDGLVFYGTSFTGDGESSGEVIFNTGMTGYQEVLTDPSYAGQMVCMTYPLIGNYGVNAEDVESDRVYVEAFIVKECCKIPSNWRAKESLPDYLKRHNVLGIEGIDTRQLTRHLRLHGAKRGIISTREADPVALVERAKAIPVMEGQNLAAAVSASSPYRWDGTAPRAVSLNKDGSYDWPGVHTAPDGRGVRVVVYDFGVKWNILRLLEAQGMDLLVVPASFTARQVEQTGAEAVFLSNGPGDPAALGGVIDELAALCQRYPVAGICLGHQLLGHALGGKTFKLKFGHHGCNHPVKDLLSGHIEISSQNHGFCVDVDSLKDVEITHVNLNDNTLEGFRHTKKPIIAIQYHPEASPGPHDSRNFFHRFRSMVREELGR